MSIATTILDQLGGQSFIAMTGASHFADKSNTLSMRLPRNKSGANRLDITLTPMDDYTMHFYKYTAARMRPKTGRWVAEKIVDKATVETVYCDTLQEQFTAITGLATHL